MTNEEKKTESPHTANARARRIRDAFPTDDLQPSAQKSPSNSRIRKELDFDESFFEEAFFEDVPNFVSNAPQKSLREDEKAESTPVYNVQDVKAEEESPKVAEAPAQESTEEAQMTPPLNEAAPAKQKAPIADESAHKKAPPQKERKGAEKATDERTEKIITIRPRAHRASRTQKNTLPFKERPFVRKTVAFAREYKQELPRNYLLFTPFLPLGVCILLIFFRILYAIAAPTTGANIYACVAIINVMAFLPLCTVYLRRRPLLRERMGWKMPTSDKIPLILIASVTLFFGAAALTSLGAYFNLTEVRYHLYTFYDIPATTSIAGILFSSVTLAIIPALTEELLCRGIIFAEYQYDNTPLALVMSAIFSAVLQFDPSRLFVGLFCGFLLGTVRMVTNSLAASIAVHIIYNIACLFYEHFFGIMGNQLSEFLILFFLCAVFALISFFFLLGAAEKFCRTYAEERKEINVDLRSSSGVALKDSLKVAFISPTLYFVLIFYFVASFFV